VFHEHLPIGKLAGFALIWLALVLYAAEGAVFNARPRVNAIPP
jgi:EamA domain-containing membrane protein RarD